MKLVVSKSNASKSTNSNTLILPWYDREGSRNKALIKLIKERNDGEED
jgi:hypothetical protein